MCAERRFDRAAGVWSGADRRAPPPSLRGEPRIRAAARGARLPRDRPFARRQVRRDHRAGRPPVVPRLPVPSRVQVTPDRTAPALPLVHRRRTRVQNVDENSGGGSRAGNRVRMIILRRIGAVIAGMIVAFLIVFAAEGIAHRIYPPPPGTNMQDMTQVKAYIATMPLSPMLVVLTGWLIATFVATWLAAR